MLYWVFVFLEKLIIELFAHISGKNGVYCDLAKNVREAFEACDLVRINCEGMNGSDYRRIGAKLKVCDLRNTIYKQVTLMYVHTRAKS